MSKEVADFKEPRIDEGDNASNTVQSTVGISSRIKLNSSMLDEITSKSLVLEADTVTLVNETSL
jgi:hypothetical protein